jgi:aspartate kinase
VCQCQGSGEVGMRERSRRSDERAGAMQPAILFAPCLRLSSDAMAEASTAEIVVMKFGGTSVAGAEEIRRAARRVVAAREQGKRVVAVLSARGKTTDELVAMAQEISDRPDPREMDMLLSTGERISCALCAMAINDLGHRAISLTGSQAGIVTDSSHTKARIMDVRADRIRTALDQDSIVLVAGFQGVSTESHDVTTLGRGGSDTTAVALAAALGGEVCEIYTDVAGVFSADPRIVPDARKLTVVSYEEMLEMAASGAKVLQLRSVEYARNHNVRIHCRSSADDGVGTLVVSESETMERPLVTAVTHSTDEARVTLTSVPDEPGVAGRIFSALAEANVNVDVIIQNEPVSHSEGADLSFTVERDDLPVAVETIASLDARIGVETDDQIGKVSIVGAGMRSHPGVAAKVFTTLGEQQINIEMISTSPIKISCVLAAGRVADAVTALHSAFELGEGTIHKEEPTGEQHRPTVPG